MPHYHQGQWSLSVTKAEFKIFIHTTEFLIILNLVCGVSIRAVNIVLSFTMRRLCNLRRKQSTQRWQTPLMAAIMVTSSLRFCLLNMAKCSQLPSQTEDVSVTTADLIHPTTFYWNIRQRGPTVKTTGAGV